MNQIPEIEPQDLDIHAKNQIIVDVRRPDEYSGELGHIEGARLITLGAELDDFLAEQKPGMKYIFVCHAGGRSARATMQALSYELDAYNLIGGMSYWVQSGLPTV